MVTLNNAFYFPTPESFQEWFKIVSSPLYIEMDALQHAEVNKNDIIIFAKIKERNLYAEIIYKAIYPSYRYDSCERTYVIWIKPQISFELRGE